MGASPGAGGAPGVRQILHDPEGYHDWASSASVDLAASDEAGYAVVHLGGVSCE
jgi:hypothetical protein